MTFGILRACYVSWLHHDCSSTAILVQPTDITRVPYTKCRFFAAPPKDVQVTLQTYRGP
jgi:hypothetical protein